MERKWLYIYTALAALLLVAGWWWIPQWTVDDAYISYRYGHHLAETGALTWNPGGERVEGFTGHVLPLLAAALNGSPHIEAWVDLINLNFLLLNVLLLIWLGAKIGLRGHLLGLLVLLFLSVPLVYVHVQSGLETSIFTCLSTAMLAAGVLFLHAPRKMGSAWALLAASMLLILTRPEGIALSTLTFGLVFFLAPRTVRLRVFLWSLPLLAVIIAYVAWRLHYFGELFPNTFYAKQFGQLNPATIKEFIRFTATYLALPVGLGWLIYVVGSPPRSAWNRSMVLVAAFFGLATLTLVLGYARSQLFMNYGFRMFFPLLPLGLLLAFQLVALGWERRGRHSETPLRQRGLLRYSVGAAGLVFGLVMGQQSLGLRDFVLNYRAVMEQEWKPAAELLREKLAPGETIICYQDAGWIPFALDHKCVDFGRLNDFYLAHVHPSPAEAADYFFAQDAGAVVMTSFEGQRYAYYEEAEYIQADPRFRAYRLEEVFSNDRGYPYHQWVYLRSDQ